MIYRDPSTNRLIEALQELTRRRNDPNRKPIELPKTLDSRDMPLSPEVDKFLEERRKYFEACKHISVGEFGYCSAF
jgi:hypothetical protein